MTMYGDVDSGRALVLLGLSDRGSSWCAMSKGHVLINAFAPNLHQLGNRAYPGVRTSEATVARQWWQQSLALLCLCGDQDANRGSYWYQAQPIATVNAEANAAASGHCSIAGIAVQGAVATAVSAICANPRYTSMRVLVFGPRWAHFAGLLRILSARFRRASLL